jgi:hypothetical protein
MAMPWVLGVSEGVGRSLMGEVPLYSPRLLPYSPWFRPNNHRLLPQSS